MDNEGIQLKSKLNLTRYRKWSKTLGEKQRKDYVKLLSIVGKSKMRGLKTYVDKYGSAGLPAVALMGLGLVPERSGGSAAPL